MLSEHCCAHVTLGLEITSESHNNEQQCAVHEACVSLCVFNPCVFNTICFFALKLYLV